jgi:hypothetical protein
MRCTAVFYFGLSTMDIGRSGRFAQVPGEDAPLRSQQVR